MFNIYIPSYKRPNSNFIKQMIDLRPAQTHIVLNHDDEANYHIPKDNKLIVPPHIKGIAGIRQFILKMARIHEYDWYWMIDDDITHFYQKIPNQCKLKLLSLSQFLEIAEEQVKKCNDETVAQIGFKKGCFGLPHNPINYGTDNGDIYLQHPIRLKNINYDTSLTVLEDTDFIFQMIENGLTNMKLNHLVFYAPKSGTLEGGLYDEYQKNAKSQGIIEFSKKYPGYLTISSENENKYRINWKKFKSHNIGITINKDACKSNPA